VKIEIGRDALKALRRMPPAKAAAIRAAIDRVADAPMASNRNIKRLLGVPHGFRIRVGDWRVSYTLHHDADLMSVFEIAPRGGAYR
jgi:mRNA interferase RelE/StbE